MAATSLSVARLLQLRITIAWQEAVAVVSAAEALSAAQAVPISLEQCCISTEGDVRLAPPGGPDAGPALSSLQLLQVMLGGEASLDDLRALAVTTDEGPAEDGGDRRLRVDLRWCLGANPRMDIARLAARGLDAGRGQRLEGQASSARELPRDRPLVRTRSRTPVERASRRRSRPAVTVRVQRLSAGAVLGIAAILLAIASGAVVTRMLAKGAERRPERQAVSEVASRSLLAGGEERTRRFDAAEPMVSPVGTRPAGVAGYTAHDLDVEPPLLLHARLPAEPWKSGGERPSALEMVIDEQGRVRQVWLDSVAPSSNDLLMVSAARAWRFRPATRNGQPVPYVLRLPLTR
ncbi:MAG: hypothetical protein AB7H81_22535 [Vicinamibacterales bacterium]